jgi:hypothetical protein
MHDRRLEVGVSFDPQRGYFTTGSELPRRLTALSLGGLRRRIEALMLPDEVDIILQLDGLAERECQRRRARHRQLRCGEQATSAGLRTSLSLWP